VFVAMNTVQRLLQRIDDAQQSHRLLGFMFAVMKKFGGDEAGNLAALIAYYGFFSLFPLLLVFASVLGMVLRDHPALQQTILDSALRNFPVIGGRDIVKNIHAIQGAGASLVVGIVGTLWGGLGVTQATQNAMNRIWGVPRKDRPNFVFSRLRGLLMLLILGTLLIASTFAGGLGASGGSLGILLRVVGIGLSLLLNFVLFALAYRVLTALPLRWGDVAPGAAVAAVLWSLLQVFGGYYVTHQIEGASNVYGTFAIVIGLLVWIYLGAQITLYCAEINVVRVRHLWPRSLVPPPLSTADKQTLAAGAKAEQQRPEERIDVEFDPSADRGRPSPDEPESPAPIHRSTSSARRGRDPGPNGTRSRLGAAASAGMGALVAFVLLGRKRRTRR
jgi:YihY family inner membrane protein